MPGETLRPGDGGSATREREEPARGRTAVRRNPARLIFMDPLAACSKLPWLCSQRQKGPQRCSELSSFKIRLGTSSGTVILGVTGSQ